MERPDPAELRARTVRLGSDQPLDTFAAAADEGHLFDSPTLTLSGHGVAARLRLDRGLSDREGLESVVAWLAAIPRDGDAGGPGTGPVAMGALAFEPGEPASLVVPRTTVTRDEHGVAWATVIGDAVSTVRGDDRDFEQAITDQFGLPPRRGATSDAVPDAGGGREDPDGVGGTASWVGRLLQLVATPEPEEFRAAVASALRAIGSGGLDKVVLARRLDLLLRADIVPSVALGRMHRREPTCTAFSYPVEDGRFLGASPELLVSRRAGFARCHPLAGTVAMSGDPQVDAAAIERLRSSGKDRAEHDLVVQAIVRGLRDAGGWVDDPGPPGVVALRSVAHLATEVLATFPELASTPSVLELVAQLHPTPAVGGVPRDLALETIRALEASARRWWAGPVGWVDASGDGDWVIGIRSALVRGPRATLWAGAGVVAGSDPASELAETTVKFLPVADALLPGVDVSLLALRGVDDGVPAS